MSTDVLIERRSQLSESKRALLARRLQGAKTPSEAGIAPCPRERPIPLSFSQQRMWFIEQLEPGTPAYNCRTALRIEGRLDVRALARGLREILRRHEALRTVIAVVDGEPRQQIVEQLELALPVVDLTRVEPHARERIAERLASREGNRCFDLGAAPLLRTTLLRLNGVEMVLLLTLHHLVWDGWSMGIFSSELAAFYEAALRARPVALRPLTIQYADFAAWQRHWLTGTVLEAQLKFWRGVLGDEPPVLELPADRPRSGLPAYRGGSCELQLSPRLGSWCHRYVQERRLTLFMLVLAAFKVLLHRLSGQTDLAVGVPIAGRQRAQTEPLIGLFVNTLVLRSDLGGNPSFETLSETVRETTLEAFAHADLPFEKLVEELQPERSLSRPPFFQVLFVLQNAPAEQLEVAGLKFRSLRGGQPSAKLDLTLEMLERDGLLMGSLVYKSELFDATTVRRWVAQLETLLSGVSERPQARIGELSVLGSAERHQLLVEHCDTGRTPAVGTVVSLFERQLEQGGDAVAAAFEQSWLSYGELDRRARRLAAGLRARGVGPEVGVALCLEPSLEMVVAMMGALRSGGYYVPIDPELPAERRSYLIEDSKAGAVLGAEALARLGEHEPPGAEVADGSREGALAYVIYTSGSTGRPKGVLVEHRQLRSYVLGVWERFGLPRGMSWATVSTVGADLGNTAIFGALCGGGALHVVARERVTDAVAMGVYLAQRRVDCLKIVPSHLGALMGSSPRPRQLLPSRLLVIGGEACPLPLARRIREQAPWCRLVNHYGPTETTVGVLTLEIGDGWRELRELPLGRGIRGTRQYVVDRRQQVVGLGVVGEIRVGGANVTRGYLGRPGATAERFVPDPFAAEPGARLYRTGDLARWRVDGTLEFLGRLDHQVKLRGFRIELGEVEAALRGCAGVEDAVVMLRGASESKRLVAWVVPTAGVELSVSELRRQLESGLTSQAVPSAIVLLVALPRLGTGKIDRRSLPEPEVGVAEVAEWSALEGWVEEELAAIWGEVLEVERVGAGADFFALGGHSLLAVRLIARVRASFGVELTLRALFEASRLREQARWVEQVRLAGIGADAPALVPVGREGALPLSFAQERLWFLDRLLPGNSVYNVPSVQRLSGPVRADLLGWAFGEVVRRHESLRTRFELLEDAPVQVIDPPAGWALPVVDLAGLEGVSGEREARRLARAEAERPFDLERGPVLRTSLVRLAASDWLLLVTLHHVVSDGWSRRILARELRELVASVEERRAPRLAEPAVQYADYACWQRQWLAGEVMAREMEFWREQLRGAPAVLELPSDRPRPALQRYRGRTLGMSLGPELSSELVRFARRRGTTLFMVLLAGYQLSLARWSGQRDVVVATPIAGRSRVELEGLIGFFVNTLALRVVLSEREGFGELLGRVREVSLEAHAHQELPFEKLVEELQPERSLSHGPLAQTMLSFESLERGSWADESAELGSRPEPSAAKFDLTLSLVHGERVFGALSWDVDLFDETTMRRFAGRYRVLLEAALAAPERSVWELPLLGPVESHQVVVEHNDTAVVRGERQLFGQRLGQQLASTPDAVAVSFGESRLSFGELDRRIVALAARLSALGVGVDDRVGLLLDRSLEMVVGFLGIIAAGAAFVPLSPSEPRRRLGEIVSEARPMALVTRRDLEPLLAGHATPVMRVDEPGPAAGTAGFRPFAKALADSALYVIYTSGSTGRPKGVVVTHGSLAYLLNALQSALYEGTARDARRLSLSAPLVFDASVQQWLQLATGRELCVIPEEARRDPGALLENCREQGVEVLDVTPTLLRVLQEAGLGCSQRDPRWVLVGGEAIEVAQWQALQTLEGIEFFNGYGPTECTVEMTMWPLARGPAEPVLGRPLASFTAYVLDPRLEPVGLGMVGELCLGGMNVSRGYLGRPGWTAARFVPDSWAGRAGRRLYRTGDLARRNAEGLLVYVGRRDHQVKLRGYRIELGEVEAALGRHPGLRESVVSTWRDESGELRLVAYVVPVDAGPTTGQLRAFLERELPSHMVPALFMPLGRLPLTVSGKVDRKALPVPEPTSERAAQPPSGAVEEVLAEIWGEVLRVERVGRDDDFFHLGGHSLLATRVLSRVRAVLGVEVPVRALFEAPTLVDFARRVEAHRRAGREIALPPLVAVARTGGLPLSFAQERLWFLDQLEPGSPAYNIPGAYRIEGQLRVVALERALAELATRHEALRTRFEVRDGVPVQVIERAARLRLPVIDLVALTPARRESRVLGLAAEQARRRFDLQRGPLVRATLLREQAQQHVLLLDLHHVVGDGWSMGIMAREMAVLYDALVAGRPSPLVPLEIQPADFAVWQRSWLVGEVLAAEITHWQDRLAGAPAVLELPVDRPRPAVMSGRGSSRFAVLGASLSASVRAFGRRLGATPFMVLLAGLQALLGRCTGQDDVSVGTPIAGRNRLEIEGLIGFFVNTLVLRTDLEGGPGFAALVARARETCLEAHTHQDVPFEKLVEQLRPERSLAHSPLFQVMFLFEEVASGGLALDQLRVSSLAGRAQSTKFDLQLGFAQVRDGFEASLTYRTDLFDGTTASRLLRHLESLLQAGLAAPERPVPELALLAPGERHQLLIEHNDTAVSWPPPLLLQAPLWAQSARTPEEVAVETLGAALSYAGLAQCATRLARALGARGAVVETRVGVCLERSLELVVAILGVLEAGATYVPLEPSYPRERMVSIIEDAQIQLVLSAGETAEQIRALAAEVIDLDRLELRQAAEQPVTRPAARLSLHPEQAAYAIYTSGSTGRPKGVVVSHRAVANHHRWLADEIALTVSDAVAQKTSIGFDPSISELFVPWERGARLVLTPVGAQGDPAALVTSLLHHRVTVLQLVPAQLGSLLEEPGLPACRALRCVVCGGDALPLEWVGRLRERRPVAAVYNFYGPTEAAIDVTSWRVAGGAPASGTAPLGFAIANTRAHVLGRDLDAQPPGVWGELYLGGLGLARGYLGRPGTTAQSFVPDALGQARGERLYRTGDRARYRADGTLEFLGRLDRQVKLRGVRIELGEVEAVLVRHPAIREVAMGVQGNGVRQQRLVAFVASEAEPVGSAQLRRWVEQHLPSYMVPAIFVELGQLPRMPSGKIDRKALLALPLETEQDERPPQLPATLVEELLAGIWAEVLGLERVGRDDSFFELGGHSLLATRVIARVRAGLSVELPLRALFEQPTLAALAAECERRLREERGQPPPPLARRQGETAPPLSFAQERLWFFDQLEPGKPIYNLPLARRMEGELSLAAFELAVNEVVRRHEVLRTRLVATDAGPVQVVDPPGRIVIPVVELARLAEDERENEAARLTAAEAVRPFDLQKGPVYRVTIVRLGARGHLLLATLHHVASDGWSMGVLERELGTLYQAFVEARPSPLAELPIQYADYAVWQRRWLSGAVLDAEIEHWRERLAGAPPKLELPTDRPRPAVQRYAGRALRVELGRPSSAALAGLARGVGATQFMVLAALFQTLLARYSGQREVVLGTPIAGRSQVETEALIGFFVNTLLLRTEVDENLSFGELLARVRELVLEAHAHPELPFERLVEALAPQRSPSYNPLFQVMLVLQNFNRGEPKTAVGALAPELGTAKFDLSLALTPAGDRLRGMLEYDVDLFDATTIRRWWRHFVALLGAAVSDPGRPLRELSLLDPAERQQLLREHNDTAVALRGPELIHDLVRLWAARAPEAVAVVGPGEPETMLSYGELERRADRLAHRLRRLGVGPEVRVGVMLERSIELPLALLAVLKAGGAYVPLDISYPRERLTLMLEDSRAAVLLSRERLLPLLGGALPSWISLDEEHTSSAVAGAAGPRAEVDADHLAYMIYTSGSTGRPKGLGVVHRGLANVLSWGAAACGPRPGERVTQIVAPGFDGAVWEIWSALTAGATLYVASEELRTSIVDLIEWLAHRRIRRTVLPTPQAEGFFAELRPGEGSLEVLMTGGDRLRQGPPPGLGFALFNFYGPAETTVLSTVAEIAPGALAPTIGRPIDNVRTYVLDPLLRPVPMGVGGELCLAGRGVGRGYLGRPALSAERFVPDPLAREAGARIYRSGDLVRMLGDGQLDFLGRLDHQVKLRGLRIELGEVESLLGRHPSVRDTAVVLRGGREGETPKIAAFLVLEPEVPAPIEELRAHLRELLPEYMVPSAWIELEQMPLSPNGKIDRRALIEMALRETPAQQAYLAPEGPVEQMLAQIWSEVLGVARVGRGDGFFELGGHSLLATRVVSRVRRDFGIELSLRKLFESPVLAQLAREIEAELGERRAPKAPPLVPAPRGGELPLSFAQERLWFLDRLEPGRSTYNVPSAFLLQGRLELSLLGAALSAVVRRHEALRTCFRDHLGRPVQVILPARPVATPLVDLRGLAERRREAERLAAAEGRRSFDLETGPLLRVCVLRLDEQTHAVLLTLHHIACDGWSMGILAREVSALYRAGLVGEPAALAEPEIQYADYASWQRGWLCGEVMEEEIAHWRERLAGAAPVLELPTDRPRPAVVSDRGASLPLRCPRELAARVRAQAGGLGATPFMLLLAVFQALLARIADQSDVSVGTPIAGRNRTEIEGLIGFFVNTLVLRSDLSGDPSLGQLVAQVREACLEAHAHQEVPFEKLVEELRPRRDLSHTPLFQVMLVLQNAPMKPLELPGLEVGVLGSGGETAKFDLSLVLAEQGEGLAGELSFNTDLFDRTTARRLARHFENLLGAALAEPERRLSSLPWLAPAEQAQLLREWNDTAAAIASTGFYELFEIQARRVPEAVAVVAVGGDDGDQVLSYAELGRRAEGLAQRLAGLGVGAEVPVGVLMERAPELVVAVLGVLAAGGAYVPLDPRYPKERLRFMLEQTRLDVLLTQERLSALVAGFQGRVIPLDTAAAGAGRVSMPAARPATESEQPAYVIFTSGSTGRPKGVVISHRAASNLAAAQQSWLGVGPGERVLQFSSISFDASVFEMVMALGSGAALVLAGGGEMLIGERLSAVLDAQRVSAATLPPSVVMALPAAEIASLKTLTVAGEACPEDLVERWAPGRRLLNLYGPTEATIWASAVACRAGGGAPTIGRPIANTRLPVLGRGLEPVPLGVPGELHIGGVGLARGYLERPALSAERFVPDPWGQGGRLYKSGDRARHRGDGEIEFLGRIDHQVKIRGVRIELGEVESSLRAHPCVADALVLTAAEPGQEHRLVAYVVSHAEVSASELRAFLRERLPEAMIPSAFMALAAFPLTPSGKVDRRALPSPSAARLSSGVAWVAPRDRLELELIGLWEEMLGVRGVGVRDDFFELGGHSLSAVRLCALIERRTGRSLPLRAIFEGATVEQVAARLGRGELPGASPGRVALQPWGGGTPWFWVHPAGGDVLCYVSLARELGEEQPFHAFESWGLEPNRAPDAEIGTMAARYLELLRQARPSGPYRLGGWSMGGVVAFEMARRLEVEGERVEQLVLLDTLNPAAVAEEVARLGTRSLLVAFAHDLGWPLDEAALTEVDADEEALVIHVWERARHAGVLGPGNELSHWRRRFEVFKTNVVALASYRPSRYGGAVLLVRAAASSGVWSGDPLLGWSGYLDGQVESVEMPGDHYTLLRPPNVKYLVALLETAHHGEKTEVLS